jgi:predicted RNA binding protein with dsRBD fold (UPF0201 family)
MSISLFDPVTGDYLTNPCFACNNEIYNTTTLSLIHLQQQNKISTKQTELLAKIKKESLQKKRFQMDKCPVFVTHYYFTNNIYTCLLTILVGTEKLEKVRENISNMLENQNIEFDNLVSAIKIIRNYCLKLNLIENIHIKHILEKLNISIHFMDTIRPNLIFKLVEANIVPDLTIAKKTILKFLTKDILPISNKQAMDKITTYLTLPTL